MSKPIHRLLVANRGEIACRVIRTCREMGIHTIAVFSDADRDALHVKTADEAIRIGPAPSTESYLVIEALIAAAKTCQADAIHPGYGFLAENADFAEACSEAGVVFVGPSPEAIRTMGSKQRAKQIATDADVPVVPGYNGAGQSDEVLQQKGAEVGFPLLVKASAGGGGKGMRIVTEAEQLGPALAAARREAAGAFGDDTLLLERYVQRPRHIEIQILGDAHGNVVHLFERECSVQRRHQKVVEETPSVAIGPELRAKMGQAAVAIASAIGYQNAGTVEFILAPNKEFYFLEVNTRLQVEHPVTECVTGIDLVREQIRIAEGHRLSFSQTELTSRGAAIEVRLYAEDPANSFLPACGTILDWHTANCGGARFDSGVETGSEVTIHYDPMLAKVIAHGSTRHEAIRQLNYALNNLSLLGVTTNRAFLSEVITHPRFVSGDFDTHFIEENLPNWSQRADSDLDSDCIAIVVSLLAAHQERRNARAILPDLESGFRNNPWSAQRVTLSVNGREYDVSYANLGEGSFAVTVGEREIAATLISMADSEIAFELAEVRMTRRFVRFERNNGGHTLVQTPTGEVNVLELPRFPEREAEQVKGGHLAPMPGKIISVKIKEGDTVEKGQVLVILEAMKMEQSISASVGGPVEHVLVSEGQQVDSEQPLVVVGFSEAE